MGSHFPHAFFPGKAPARRTGGLVSLPGQFACFRRFREMKRFAVLICFTAVLAAAAGAQVSFDRIAGAVKQPQDWLTYSGNLAGRRHSSLIQITPQNAANLDLKWVYQAESL